MSSIDIAARAAPTAAYVANYELTSEHRTLVHFDIEHVDGIDRLTISIPSLLAVPWAGAFRRLADDLDAAYEAWLRTSDNEPIDLVPTGKVLEYARTAKSEEGTV